MSDSLHKITLEILKDFLFVPDWRWHFPLSTIECRHSEMDQLSVLLTNFLKALEACHHCEIVPSQERPQNCHSKQERV